MQKDFNFDFCSLLRAWVQIRIQIRNTARDPLKFPVRVSAGI
jgi:hypothetical protein